VAFSGLHIEIQGNMWYTIEGRTTEKLKFGGTLLYEKGDSENPQNNNSNSMFRPLFSIGSVYLSQNNARR